MRCEEVREEADLYAIGALDADEREALERHAESCPGCQELLERATIQAGRLGFAAPSQHAPAELRRRILRDVANDERSPAERAAPIHFSGSASVVSAAPWHARRPGVLQSWGRVAAVAATVLLLVGGGAWIARMQMQMNRLSERSQTLQRRVADFQSQRDAIMLLASEGTSRFAMQSTDSSTGASGAVIWNPDQRKCSVLAAGLPAAGRDQVYHVWLMGGNRSWDEGELIVAENGMGEKTIDLSRYAAQDNYQLVASRQPRQPGSGEWQPILRAWVGE
jgi:hypothetical protein